MIIRQAMIFELKIEFQHLQLGVHECTRSPPYEHKSCPWKLWVFWQSRKFEISNSWKKLTALIFADLADCFGGNDIVCYFLQNNQQGHQKPGQQK